MDSTSWLITQAVALALATVGMPLANGSLQPTIWAHTAGAPPELNVFYQADAARAARRWQAAHWAQYDETVMTSNGRITLDDTSLQALIVTIRTKERGGTELQYVMPYDADGAHVSIYPFISLAHGNCALLAPEQSDAIINGIQQNIDNDGTFEAIMPAAPLPIEENACNAPRNV